MIPGGEWNGEQNARTNLVGTLAADARKNLISAAAVLGNVASQSPSERTALIDFESKEHGRQIITVTYAADSSGAFVLKDRRSEDAPRQIFIP